jgi:hypothetical protein
MAETLDRRTLDARRVRAVAWDLRRVAVVASYAVLGTTLVFSRLVDLGESYWFDEVVAVSEFVRAGPREILVGPLSHELYVLIAWATAASVGESETALRLWSAVPYILGAGLVTVWLHRRHNPLAGVLFLFLATVSPLLLDVSRQARGYGLAFLAMGVMVAAAIEAVKTRQTAAVVAMCVAGVLGSWTLPQFTIAFAVTLAVVVTDRPLRRRAVIGGALALAAIAAWFAPHLLQVRDAAGIANGMQVNTGWLLTAPLDQILLPALFWIEGMVAIPGLTWLPFVLLAAAVMWSSPYLRDLRTGSILCAGPVATIAVLWVTQAFYWPRYLSYLAVPLFVLLASGASEVFKRLPTRPAIVRTVVCVVAICYLAINFVSVAPEVVGQPRQANRDAARLIDARSPATTPVLTYMTGPRSIAFYLGRPVQNLDGTDVAAEVCGRRVPVVYVMEPFGVEPVDVPCLTRPGVTHVRFRQYAGGHQMNVWFVPPAT